MDAMRVLRYTDQHGSQLTAMEIVPDRLADKFADGAVTVRGVVIEPDSSPLVLVSCPLVAVVRSKSDMLQIIAWLSEAAAILEGDL